MKILVINCGSSSIKYRLFEMPQQGLLAKGLLEKIGEGKSFLKYSAGKEEYKLEQQVSNHNEGLELILSILTDKKIGVINNISEISAVGHRVVHGGEKYSGSVPIDDAVIKVIEDFADLAPLHNPPNLAGINAAINVLPGVPQVACFDTAFHQTMPRVAYMYALPYELYEKYRIRRYGFHGTSHRYVARRFAEILKKDKYTVNVITCHLGNGTSITAVKEGISVDTSMGFTPLEGTVMGTRSGDVDPSIGFYLIRKGYTADQIDNLLNKKSGLLGLSGVGNDMRTILQKAKEGNDRAQLAVDIFCYRIKKYIGAYSAVLGKVDGIIFTGGIGENAVEIRSKSCSGMQNLGIVIDEKKNATAIGRESKISTDNSPVYVWVIPTDEEIRIAVDTYKVSGLDK
ncbi:acetate kinase [Candidatus Desantisbacteria bacterium CG1_02_38_46]|uniref:Acetate kinase n=1 Tax=Candidatus Desantisbacteria bacterium CG1_02_38_46 TaxID=1817893 RepID=A0A1J4SAS9_9BACT|nr:MAG: acetate kinase [Candidatus Desantisbacteria bacterium CG1_02_38_46]